MPQLIPPTSLYQAALQSVKESVLTSCLLIQQQFGTYDTLNCKLAIEEFQQYLVDNIPGHIIDILCNTTNVVENCFSNDFDFRILFSVYMHDNMRIFCPQIKVNLDDTFWQCKFRVMKNLVILDLKLICTDEILQVVGESCKKLEFINVVSKTEKITCSFNALKVKYFVSDLGLQYMSKCSNLQVIIMPRVIRSQSSGFKITHNGIMYVLQSLPKLKLITYSDIGTVIRNNVDMETSLRLSLRSIIDYHCENLQMPLILKICPHLSELHLNFSIHDIMDPKIETVISKTMKVLATSDMKLTVLSVHLLCFCDSFKLFLVKKGIHIVTISLWVESEFNQNDVICLGECCPNIEKVHLYILCKFDNSSVCKHSKNMFSELRILILEMLQCSNILIYFLSSASYIKQIVVKNMIITDSMDEIIDELMILNSFLELEELHLGIQLSFANLLKFVLFCPVLKTIQINENLVCFQNISSFNQNLKSKNFNTEIILVKPSFKNTSVNPFIY